MNKKNGFTLIELLGVIVLLGVIGLLVYPTIGKVIKDNKQKLYDKQISELERIVYNYAIDNNLGYEDNVEKQINFSELIDKGYINDLDVKNPINGESLKGCMVYKWVATEKKYQIRYSEECRVENAGSIDLDVDFISLGLINSDGWYNKDFYVDITIEGASSYSWCGTTNDTCEPNSLVNDNTGSVLINNESNSNIICVVAYDSEGNYTNKKCSENYQLDKTGPTFTGLTEIVVAKGFSVNLQSGVNVIDDLSGLNGTYSIEPESVDTSTIGVKTVTYEATDLAGNKTTKTRNIRVESNAPVLTFNPRENANTNGWYNNDITIDINVTDDSGLGINNTKWCETIGYSCTPETSGTTAVITNESEYAKICAQSTDNSGKTSSIICSNTYKLDKTKPYFNGIADLSVEKGANVNLTYGVTANDALSQIDGTFSVSPNSVDTSIAGVTSVTYSVTDKAGNTKEITRTISVSTEVPTLTFTPTSTPNSNGWYNNTFFVAINVIDNSGSGISNTKWCGTLENTCTPDTEGTNAQVSLEGSSTRICAESIDNSGKSSGVLCSGTYMLDKTGPSTPTITGGSNDYVLSSSISINSWSTDTLSGNVIYEYYLTNSSTIPTKSTTATASFISPMAFTTDRAGDYIYVRAVDQAGNVSEWSNVERLFIDTTTPTITAKGSNYSIIKGTNNVISSTYFTINQGGTASVNTECVSNVDGVVTNTSSLSYGTHTITCTTSKSTGKSVNASVTIKVGTSLGGQFVEVVTTGDGLYYENDGSFRFRGSAPNNYVQVGSTLYRIISVDAEGIKVVQSTSYSNSKFDNGNYYLYQCSGQNSNPGDLCYRYNGNNTFCQYSVSSSDMYTSCNVWAKASSIKQNGVVSSTYTNGNFSGTVSDDSWTNYRLNGTYYNDYLASYTSKIVSDATWNIGPVTKSGTVSIEQLVTQEKAHTWDGRIALITLSDYVRAQAKSSSNYNLCIVDSFGTNCKNDNWLSSYSGWLLSPASSSTDYGFLLMNGSIVSTNYASMGIYPSFYLKNTVTFTGSGSSSVPYVLN